MPRWKILGRSWGATGSVLAMVEAGFMGDSKGVYAQRLRAMLHPFASVVTSISA
ncbi:hypothetical protein ACNKHR_17395 [Shigella flexneri]